METIFLANCYRESVVAADLFVTGQFTLYRLELGFSVFSCLDNLPTIPPNIFCCLEEVKESCNICRKSL